LSVLGLGTDLVAVPRMARILENHGVRFLARCFRPDELSPSQDGDPAAVAGRWAAKEALLKALGTDVRHIPYRDIEVCRHSGGPVSLRLHGAALEALDGRGGGRIHLSISHERDHALAVVIIGS